MTNLTDRTDKYYVAKVSKRSNTVEFMNVSNISGAISFRTDMESGHLSDAGVANRIANFLNGIYKELGMEIYCYRVNSAETNVHAISNASDEYKAIVRAHYGQLPEEEEAPEEEPAE